MNRRTFTQTLVAGAAGLAVGVTPEADLLTVKGGETNAAFKRVWDRVADLRPQPTYCPVTGEKLAPQQLCTDDGWRPVLFKDLKEGDVMRTWFEPEGWGKPYRVTRVIDRNSLKADPLGLPTEASWSAEWDAQNAS